MAKMMNRSIGAALLLTVAMTAAWAPTAPGPSAPPSPPAQPSPPPAQIPPSQPAPPPAQPEFQNKLDRLAEVLARMIGDKHGSADWRRQTAVQADIVIELTGQSPLQATMIHEVNRGRTRLNLKDGTVLINDGEKAWISPASASLPHAHFHLTAWPAFLTAPFNLHTRDLQPTAYKYWPLARKQYDTFIHVLKPAREGSASPPSSPLPPPQRRIYAIIHEHILHAIGGIHLNELTGDAPEQAHCIVFEEYETIDKVKLATKWSFWKYKNDIEGDSIGQATLTNVKFITPAEGTFDKPAEAREIAEQG